MVSIKSIHSPRDHFLEARQRTEWNFITGLLYACSNNSVDFEKILAIAGPDAIQAGPETAHDLSLIYQAMLECHHADLPINTLSIFERMLGKHQKGKGPEPDSIFLAQLCQEGIYLSSFLEHSARRLAELNRREKISQIALVASEAAYDMDKSPEDVLQLFESAVEHNSPSMLTRRTLSELLQKEYPPLHFVLSPIIPHKGLVMLYAARGIGKTFGALSIACAVIAGGKVFGRWEAPEPLKVLYIDGEMPTVVMRERLLKLTDSSHYDLSFADNLHILTPDEQDCPMPNLATIAGQKAIEPFLSGVTLIIIDNLATLARHGRSNDEESWIPMQSWLLELRRRGFSVLLVHHAGKSGDQRGTSAKEDILDTIINFRRPADYQSDQGARFEVHLTKASALCGDEAKPFEVSLISNPDGSLDWLVRDLEDANESRIQELLQLGMSYRDIAEEISISKSAVGRIAAKLKRNGLGPAK